MSGHSKWSTIKRKKAANDAKRGQIFTRLAREITIAARDGGDPETNFTLRLAIDRARAANMPKDNIERAIKRGTGELKGEGDIEEVIYEAYAPNGVALLIHVVTDNRNRTLAEVKHALTRSGGNMAELGSVSWQFEQKGYLTVSCEQCEYDDVFLVAADAGAEDVIDGDEFIEVLTSRELLQTVRQALEDAGFPVEEARLDWLPQNEIELAPDVALKVMHIIEDLEDLDDTQTVYSNLSVTDELMASFEAA
jgi:YebC/PmpR family DNA-binding regulatory protein